MGRNDMINFMKTLDIDEIRNRVSQYGPYEWINPSNITGLNKELIKKENKERWFSPIGSESNYYDNDTDDERNS